MALIHSSVCCFICWWCTTKLNPAGFLGGGPNPALINQLIPSLPFVPLAKVKPCGQTKHDANNRCKLFEHPTPLSCLVCWCPQASGAWHRPSADDLAACCVHGIVFHSFPCLYLVQRNLNNGPGQAAHLPRSHTINQSKKGDHFFKRLLGLHGYALLRNTDNHMSLLCTTKLARARRGLLLTCPQ